MVFLDDIRLTDAELAAMVMYAESRRVLSNIERQERTRPLTAKQKHGRKRNKAARKARARNKK